MSDPFSHCQMSNLQQVHKSSVKHSNRVNLDWRSSLQVRSLSSPVASRSTAPRWRGSGRQVMARLCSRGIEQGDSPTSDIETGMESMSKNQLIVLFVLESFLPLTKLCVSEVNLERPRGQGRGQSCTVSLGLTY